MGPTHHLLPNVRFTELRSREEKSTVRIDRKPLLVVGGKSYLSSNAVRSTNVTEPYKC